MDMQLSIADVVQAGGVLAFATMVYLQLREQTKILRETGSAIVKILERQDVIMDRQDSMKRDLSRAGLKFKTLPPKPMNGPQG